jgi:hypothetical protein
MTSPFDNSSDIQAFIQNDIQRFDIDRPKNFTDLDKRPFNSSLPYKTTPKIKNSERMEPAISTQFKGQKVCFNDALNEQPFYNRYFPNFDYFSVRPTIGDISQDPKYGMITKDFSTGYRQSK